MYPQVFSNRRLHALHRAAFARRPVVPMAWPACPAPAPMPVPMPAPAPQPPMTERASIQRTDERAVRIRRTPSMLGNLDADVAADNTPVTVVRRERRTNEDPETVLMMPEIDWAYVVTEDGTKQGYVRVAELRAALPGARVGQERVVKNVAVRRPVTIVRQNTNVICNRPPPQNIGLCPIAAGTPITILEIGVNRRRRTAESLQWTSPELRGDHIAPLTGPNIEPSYSGAIAPALNALSRPFRLRDVLAITGPYYAGGRTSSVYDEIPVAYVRADGTGVEGWLELSNLEERAPESRTGPRAAAIIAHFERQWRAAVARNAPAAIVAYHERRYRDALGEPDVVRGWASIGQLDALASLSQQEATRRAADSAESAARILLSQGRTEEGVQLIATAQRLRSNQTFPSNPIAFCDAPGRVCFLGDGPEHAPGSDYPLDLRRAMPNGTRVRLFQNMSSRRWRRVYVVQLDDGRRGYIPASFLVDPRGVRLA